MSKDYFNEFLPDLDEFREKTIQFHNKELTVPQYKSFSGGFGSYAQRGGQKHMLRLRMTGGRLTKDRLSYVIETCDKYKVDLIKTTTCQSLQLHNLDVDTLCETIEEAWQAGMISRGGGGDFPRNVMATSLTGLLKDEYFDVLPYAEAAGNYLMNFIKSVKFPRKLKVCFSSCPTNEPHATFRDLGFVARPDHTFDVYIAGGLGNNPKLGVKVCESIDPAKVLYYVKAMVDTFVTYGNYENRGKSRTRYLQETLGVDGLKKAYIEKLNNVFESEDLEIITSDKEGQALESDCAVAANNKSAKLTSNSVDSEFLSNPRITVQKQNGLYSVFYQPICGILPFEQLKEIFELIKPMEAVEIRLTPAQGLYIVNCSLDEAKVLLTATANGANTLFEQSVACAGSAICQVGLGNSPAMLEECIKAVRKENFANGVLPKVHFSGCPSSCSAHQTGSIGFRGAMKPSADGPKPAFAIFVGGCDYQGDENIADTGKSMLCDDIPKFFVELGHIISDANSTYDQWILTHRDDLNALIDKYTS